MGYQDLVEMLGDEVVDPEEGMEEKPPKLPNVRV